ncbi:DNAJC17 isoform 5 [Pan troglodytes]|uniref:DnaJ homolog subfamily C member 17 n=2 Tax=Homininae TaxID=207598 RepID=H0YK99_HUMAN|nr:DnaJ heat shock protein family (Hsp40) member C17 [Homo sapiens]KAI4057213.1 DnaJ heat shock protein family (Hsp40) member C17 [Homo sapiens]PNI94375.1 DNAJC17 isoform 5 [Pan troglodytes]
MAVTKELLQMDLYALLGIEEKAADKEVKKAYRQKALSCHPDKNPDNPRAAELFHQLSQALEVLTDAAARAAYDKVRKAKKQAAERTQKLDEKRKKVKLGRCHHSARWPVVSCGHFHSSPSPEASLPATHLKAFWLRLWAKRCS